MDELKLSELAKFQPRQYEALGVLLDPQCKYLLYGGAAYGGKSYFLRWAALYLGFYYWNKYHIANVPIGLFSEDYPTLRDRQISKIVTEFPPYLGKLGEYQDIGLAFRTPPNLGSFNILLRNLDDPSKYSSVEFAAILVEELTKNRQETFEYLRFRLRFPAIKEVKFIGASNPGEIGHGWVKKFWIKPDPKSLDFEQDRFFFVRALYSDNKFITKDYINQLKSLPDEKRKAWMEGNWDVFTGQFFGEWDATRHICSPFNPFPELDKYGGMDWGRTAPFCFLAGALEKVDGEGKKFHRLWIYNEIYETNQTPEELAKKIKLSVHLEEFQELRADPSMFKKKEDGSESLADMFSTNGVDLMPADNDRKSGWEVIHNWLRIAPDGKPYLRICKNCVNLTRTLPELVFDEKHPEDIPTNSEDHAADALRYLLKHVTWIDASVGSVERVEKEKLPRFAPETLDLSQFEITPRRQKSWKVL